MKKIVRKFLIILIIYFMFPCLVNAATSLNTQNQRPIVGTSFEVTMIIDYGNTSLINEAHYYISYDPTYIRLDNISWTQGAGNYSVDNGIITIDKDTSSSPWSNGGPIVLRMTAIFPGKSKIEIREKAPAKYSDNSVVAQSYSGITINAVSPSTATIIGDLEVEGFTIAPTFNRETFNYTLTVPSSVTEVNVKASKGERNQTITGTGKRILNYGDNRVRVIVTAQNGESSTYEIMIVRTDDRSGDVSLKHLSVEGTTIAYVPGQTHYEATVSRTVENIFLTAQTTDPKAQLIGTGSKNLRIGENNFELVVSSKNGVKQSYYIKIIRSEDEFKENVESSKVEVLTLNGTNIPVIDGKNTYFFSVPKDIENLPIYLKTKSTTATYVIENDKNLKVGLNKIKISISDINNEISEYFIVVYKQPGITTKVNGINEITETQDHIYYETLNPEEIKLDILDKLNINKQKLYYNVIDDLTGLKYQLIIPNNTYQSNINPSVVKLSDTPLTYTINVPAGIDVLIRVNDTYPDNSELKIFTYNDMGMYTSLTSGVKVVNGYVTFTTNGQANYVLTTQDLLGGPKKSILDYMPIIFFIALIGIASFIIIKKKKKIEKLNSNEPLY